MKNTSTTTAAAIASRSLCAHKSHWHLADAFLGLPAGPYDLIACRNVAIYLEHAAAARLWRRLHLALRPAGLLLTGKAERPTSGFLRRAVPVSKGPAMSQALPKSSRVFEAIRRRPSPFVGIVVSIAAFLLVVYVQIMALGKWQAGLTYALPMFLCLWTRQRPVLYLLAVGGSILAFYKNFWLVGETGGLSPAVVWVFQLINIWASTFAIHIAIYALDRLDVKRRILSENNEELEEANKELATREEQVVQQNQELQTQTEELRSARLGASPADRGTRTADRRASRRQR